jgi:hypothetical protein
VELCIRPSREGDIRMTGDAEPTADPLATTMPAALAAIIYRYDKATRRTIVSNWALIGSDGHRNYREYLDSGLPWTRSRRARTGASQLIVE